MLLFGLNKIETLISINHFLISVNFLEKSTNFEF
jgi:hypothetical protein